MAHRPQVRRSDGSVEPLRERQLAESAFRALTAAGTPDRELAQELAGVVLLFIEKYHQGQVPSAAEVDELLVRVLRETGHESAARLCEQSQRERLRLEQDVTVRRPAPDGSPWGLREVTEEVRPWSRERLVKSLVRGSAVPLGLAEELAAAVESRLLAADLRSVSPALVGELVDYEFASRDLVAPRRSPVFQLTAEALQDLATREGPASLDRRIAAKALPALASRGIFGQEVVRSHGQGRLHVYGLEDPFKVERATVPVALLVAGLDLPLGDLALAFRRRLDLVRAQVREEVVLPDAVVRFGRHPEAHADPQRAAGLLLEALDVRDAWEQPNGPIPNLGVPLGHHSGVGSEFLSAVRERCLALAARDLIRADFVMEASVKPDVQGLQRLLESGPGVPGVSLRIQRQNDPPLDPDLVPRPIPLGLSLARVAINLPLTLLDAQGLGLKDINGDLQAAAKVVREAFLESYWHQRGGVRFGLQGLVVALGGPAHVQVHGQNQEVDLEVWGLGHAVELLERRNLAHPGRRPQTVARLLSTVDYALGEEVGGVQFRVRFSAVRDRAVRKRLVAGLEIHAERLGVQDVQDILRDEGLRDRSSLPVAVPLFSSKNEELLRGAFAERLRGGLALPLAACVGGEPTGWLERLRDETHLGAVGLAPILEGGEVFEVQEELFS